MDKVRLGIIGLGNMGSQHSRDVLDGKVEGLELTAVCNDKEKRLTQNADIKNFPESGELIRSGEVDAVLISTPHYDHTTIGIDALENGLHVMVEKPISVHKADCERLIAAHTDEKQVFAAMFNQRTNPHYRKLREMILSGELGEIRRVVWITTNWFRPQIYYTSVGWRATWAGEGGGVLLNQCPHQLDLWQWMFGMPKSVRAFCDMGRYHEIEVEDDVTAYLEYDNGCKGVFIATTGEAPGTNRLEVTAESGRVIIDDEGIHYTRIEAPMSEWNKTATGPFSSPASDEVDLQVEGKGGQHIEVLQNFTNAILKDEELISPAAEGIHSVELANAMLYSTFTVSTVELPLDGAAYEARLKDLIANSTFKKEVTDTLSGPQDLSGSF